MFKENKTGSNTKMFFQRLCGEKRGMAQRAVWESKQH